MTQLTSLDRDLAVNAIGAGARHGRGAGARASESSLPVH
jgi:hypothetical protein